MLVVDLSVGRGNVDLASCVLDPEPGEEKPPGSSYLETCLCTEWTPGLIMGHSFPKIDPIEIHIL
jgi:hypothetical protein